MCNTGEVEGGGGSGSDTTCLSVMDFLKLRGEIGKSVARPRHFANTSKDHNLASTNICLGTLSDASDWLIWTSV